MSRQCLGLLVALVCSGSAPALIYHGVALAPDGQNGWVVTIETTAVYHTTDGGANWEPQNVPTVRDFFDVFFLDGLSGWTCGRIGDIWHTTNGGNDWYRQNLGGPKFATRMQFIDENFGWAAGGEAILMHSTNGGSEWQLEFFPNPPYPSSIVDFQGLSLLGPNNGWLVAGRYPEGDSFWGGQGYIVHVRADADSFIKNLVRLDTTYDFFGVDFVNEQTGWVVGGYDRNMRAVVLHTTNGGATWTEQSLPPSAKYLRAVDFVDAENGWACGRHGTIIRTSDGGATWVAQYCPADTTLFDIQFVDATRGLCAGNSLVLYTTDGGEHWIRSMGGVAEQAGQSLPSEGPLITVARSPVRGRVELRFAGPGQIAIHNPAGRLVRKISGDKCVVWDGRDDYGRPVENGLYVVRLTTAVAAATTRFVYLEE